jgi:hypothetical protein
MSGAYPHFKSCYTHEELVEHFLLTLADPQLVFGTQRQANKSAIATAAAGYADDMLGEKNRR